MKLLNSTYWVERRAFENELLVSWNGWVALASCLRKKGWNFEKIFYRATGKQKLYIRHPELRLVGRSSNFRDDWAELEFLTLERNYRVKPPKQYTESEIVDLENLTILDLLEMVESKQSSFRKPAKLTIAEIIEFIRKVAA